MEIPLLSKEAEEDRLGFVRPRNMELFKAKGSIESMMTRMYGM